MNSARKATGRASVTPSGLTVIVMAAILAVAAAIGACGGGDGGEDATATPDGETSPTRSARPSPTVSPTETEVGMELDEFVIRPDQTRARPGPITFKVRNAGEIPHQFVVIKSDLPIAELPRLPDNGGADLNELDVEDRIELIGAGEEAELTVDLTVGGYVIICNLAPGGESHYLNGMYNGFDVRADAPLDSPEASRTP